MHLRGKRFEYDIVHDDGSVGNFAAGGIITFTGSCVQAGGAAGIEAGTKLRAVRGTTTRRTIRITPIRKVGDVGDQTCRK